MFSNSRDALHDVDYASYTCIGVDSVRTCISFSVADKNLANVELDVAPIKMIMTDPTRPGRTCMSLSIENKYKYHASNS